MVYSPRSAIKVYVSEEQECLPANLPSKFWERFFFLLPWGIFKRRRTSSAKILGAG